MQFFPITTKDGRRELVNVAAIAHITPGDSETPAQVLLLNNHRIHLEESEAERLLAQLDPDQGAALAAAAQAGPIGRAANPEPRRKGTRKAAAATAEQEPAEA